MNRELLFSVTAKDFEWTYTRGSGAGGQHRNKTDSAVHVFHPESGARSYSCAGRSQHANRRDAFKKIIETKEFKTWQKLEIARRLGDSISIEEKVNKLMNHNNIKVEVRRNNRWVLESEVLPEGVEEVEGV